MTFKPGFRHIPVAAIKVGQRYRRDLGDLVPLIESIKRNRLLHPLVIDQKGNLIGGARRLAAVKRVGWKRVPVHVMALDDPLQAEADENFARADFLPSERVAIAEALMEAAHSGQHELARLLLNHGADPAAVEASGRTALSMARAAADQQMGDLLAGRGATL